MAGAPMRLPFAAIDAYARRHGIAGQDFDLFHALIGALDEAYLEHAHEELRQQTKHG